MGYTHPNYVSPVGDFVADLTCMVAAARRREQQGGPASMGSATAGSQQGKPRGLRGAAAASDAGESPGSWKRRGGPRSGEEEDAGETRWDGWDEWEVRTSVGRRKTQGATRTAGGPIWR